MDALRSVPARAGAVEKLRLARSIFARPSAGAGAIGLADIAGLRRILRDVVARIVGRIGRDRIELVGLLGIDLLGRALLGAASQKAQAEDRRGGEQAGPHIIPLGLGHRLNASSLLSGIS